MKCYKYKKACLKNRTNYETWEKAVREEPDGIGNPVAKFAGVYAGNSFFQKTPSR